MSANLPKSLVTLCQECGEEFYGEHLEGCSEEEDLETCGICGEFYIGALDTPYPLDCWCGPNEKIAGNGERVSRVDAIYYDNLGRRGYNTWLSGGYVCYTCGLLCDCGEDSEE